MVAEAVHHILHTHHMLWRASQVQEYIEREFGVSLTTGYIVVILRRVLGMRFRKIKLVTFKTNSINNLVLRQ